MRLILYIWPLYFLSSIGSPKALLVALLNQCSNFVRLR